MIRQIGTRTTLGLCTLALAVGVIACSASSGGGGGFGTPSGGDNGGVGTPTNSNGSSNDTTGTGSSGGTSSGTASTSNGGQTSTGTGPTSSGTVGTTTGGGSSSGGAASSSGGSSGAVGSSAGDGGIVTDLAPPPSGTGIQIATPPYSASDPNAANMIVQPGQEIFLCYYVTLPAMQVEVGAFQSWMSEGSSHHFIVFQGGGATGAFSGPAQASGTISQCGFGAGQWIYATSTPGEVVEMKMPQGVGYPFPASTQVILNMHFINPGSTVLYPAVKLNILFATNVQYQAAAMVSFNTQINVPAATAAGPGTQTVSGTCTAPAGSKFFVMSTHTHKHATAAIVNFVHAGSSQQIVYTGTTSTYPADQESGSGTDWEHPGVGVWNAPNFLTTVAGDTFTYSCSYSNTASTPVTVGETAASNEMCMAIGYYFPAGSTSCD